MPLPGRTRRDQQERPGLPGGQALRGPERAYFQRLTGDYYTKVSSTGKLTLTATHVVFNSIIGASVSVPLADVAEVRDQKIRRFHVRGHDSQLVLATRSGEIGFLVADPAAWAGAIRGQLPVAEGPPSGRAGT